MPAVFSGRWQWSPLAAEWPVGRTLVVRCVGSSGAHAVPGGAGNEPLTGNSHLFQLRNLYRYVIAPSGAVLIQKASGAGTGQPFAPSIRCIVARNVADSID